MKLEYNITGPKRKELAAAVAKATNHYCRYVMPGFRYQVGPFTVTKEGNVEVPDGELDEAQVNALVDALAEAGFKLRLSVEKQGLCISLPREGFSDDAIENLKKITAGKKTQIMKAMKATSVEIKVTEDSIDFPWFDHLPDSDEIKAYTIFIAKLGALAKRVKRVQMVDHESDNEKYEFRTFLLRLGMIGDSYKESRTLLLKNLTGSSAFRYGKGNTRRKLNEKILSIDDQQPVMTIRQEGEADGTNAE